MYINSIIRYVSELGYKPFKINMLLLTEILIWDALHQIYVKRS